MVLTHHLLFQQMATAEAPSETAQNADAPQEFYLRYYVGHSGRYGHEFLEFEITQERKLRYVNNSAYKKDGQIRKHSFQFILYIC